MGGIAIFSNGWLQTTAGSSAICLLADQLNRPVYVLIKTYKFSEKTEINAFNQNYNFRDVDNFYGASGAGTQTGADMIQLKYDLVKSSLISLLVTEVGLMPSTSVPVILEELKKDEFY